MATPFETAIREAHPWWFGNGIAGDPHLRRFERSPVPWDPPALASIPLRFGDTHTLRGPRQAGKTTTVKRLIQGLVDRGESRILYHSFDLGADPQAIPEVVRQAKRLHPAPEGPWFLFLDEITSVPDWQVGVKVAWDSGLTADDAIVLTASSAHDLKRGAERLPGRRGKGRDYLQLPMSFRDFCSAAKGVVFDDEPLWPEEFLTARGERATARLMSQQSKLAAAFEEYLNIGGFPVAVADHAALPQHDVAPETLQSIWEILAGDINKSGRNALAALKLLDAMAVSLGSTLSWQSAARAMGFEAPAVARDYAEFLAESFALLAVYYWDIGRQSLEPNKQRKLYWLDPVLGRIPRLMIPGSRAPSEDGLVENAVASGLFRSAAQTLIQANAIPGTVGYWRSSAAREVDFLIPQVTDLQRERLPVEVKGDNATGLNGARQTIRQRFRKGIVLSRSVLDWRADIATLPVWLFLAGLREQPHRTITLG
jgi:hypothetical protein